MEGRRSMRVRSTDVPLSGRGATADPTDDKSRLALSTNPADLTEGKSQSAPSTNLADLKDAEFRLAPSANPADPTNDKFRLARSTNLTDSAISEEPFDLGDGITMVLVICLGVAIGVVCTLKFLTSSSRGLLHESTTLPHTTLPRTTVTETRTPPFTHITTGKNWVFS